MPAQKKIDIVQKINRDVVKAKTIVISDHTGLTHKDLEKLRKNVKKAGGNFIVTKNTFLKKALLGTPFEGKIEQTILTGPTSVLLAIDDEISALSELYKTIKELNLPKVKGGALTDKVLTINDIISLSQLPSKEVLIGQLLGMMKSPHTRLVFALKGNLIKLVLLLKAVSEKKQVN